MLGERIRQLRIERGLTQDELADKLNVVRTTVAGWEKGKRTPDIFMLCKIADTFEMSLDDLVGRKIE